MSKLQEFLSQSVQEEANERQADVCRVGDFFMGLTDLAPEESNIPFWVWVDESRYTENLGMNYFLRFQPNKNSEKMQEVEKYPVLMLDSLTIWNVPEDMSLSEEDIKLLRKWVVLNRENLKLLSQMKMTRTEFLRTDCMRGFVEHKSLFTEMSVVCSTKDTGLPVLVKVDVGENSFAPLAVVFYAYRADKTGDLPKGAWNSNYVPINLNTLLTGILPRDTNVTDADIMKIKRWVKACKGLIQDLLDRQIKTDEFLHAIRRIRV